MPLSPFNLYSYVVGAGSFSPETFSFDPSKASGRAQFYIKFGDTYTTVRDILGYPKRNAQGNLIRSLPYQWVDPALPPMWAMSVADVQYLGAPLTVGANGLLPGAPKYPQYTNTRLGLGGLTGNYSTRMWVNFATPAYRICGEQDISVNGVQQEWQRWTTVVPTPTLDILQAERGQYKWAATGAGGPVVGQAIQNGWNIRVPGAELTIVWYDLPNLGVYDSSGNLNPNWLNLQGCVNNRPFLGYPTGTLLCSSHPRLTPFTTMVRPEDMGQGAGTWAPRWNCELKLTYRDPQPAYANGTGVRGWSLIPYPQQTTPGVTWYPVTNDGQPLAVGGTNGLYIWGDFTKLFQLAQG